jgi:hypothetical protein
MSKYSILPAYLHAFADSAEFIIKQRYGLGKALIEEPIENNIGWRPTLHWKTKTGIVTCEVSESPFPVVFNQILTDVIDANIPVRIIAAFPIEHTLSASEYQLKRNKAKSLGLGLLPVSPGNVGNIEYAGVSIPLRISAPNVSSFKKALHKDIKDAFELYMNGDPKHGVQELGQLVENILVQLADQAKKKGNLTTGGFISPTTYYAQNTLVQDLIKDKIIDNKILKKCASFADDRNSVSHKPNSPKEAIKLEKRLKDLFNTGLYILEELPEQMVVSGYRLKT